MHPQDNRRFRRYSKNTPFSLYISDKIFRAQVIDYSLEGIGAAVIGEPPLKKGDIVSLTVTEPDIRTVGEVMWTQRINAELRIGVRNIGQLKGHLKDYHFTDIVMGLQRSAKTGTFSVENGNIIRNIFLRNGDMIFSTSNHSEDRLGMMLLQEGTISPEQYTAALHEMHKTNRRLGTVLVRLGYLHQAELATAVRRQVEKIIHGIFRTKEGKFVMNEGQLPKEEVITLKLSAANLIYHGIRKMDDLDFVKEPLPSSKSIPSFSSNPLDLFQDLRLDEEGRKIVTFVDGKTSIDDIIALSRLESIQALKTIYAFLCARLITVRENNEPPLEAPQTIIKEAFEEERGEEIDSEARNMIEDMHGRYSKLGYYGVLDVSEEASPDAIRNAYYCAARKFHPDRHFHLNDDSLKKKLSEIFSYVYEAYAALSHPVKRAEYDRMITLRPARLTTNQDKARSLYEEGRHFLWQQNYHDATLRFGQATYFDGNTAEYHYYYGLALTKQNRYRDAEKALERALKLEPFNAAYLTELGYVFLELGYKARARSMFEKALKLSPGHQRASEGIGKATNR